MKIPLLPFAICLFALAGCGGDPNNSSSSSSGSGGANAIGFAKSSVNLTLDENISGNFWTASVIAPNSTSKPLHYNLGGADANLFAINDLGQLSFLQPADYEKPQDKNRDNIYNLQIIALQGNQSATQNMDVTINNIETPKLFIKWPYANDNVGQGIDIAVDVTAQFWDYESNVNVNVAAIDLNGIALKRISDYDWVGKIVAHPGETTLTINANYNNKLYSDTRTIKNVPNILAPKHLGIVSGQYLVVSDANLNALIQVCLQSTCLGQWEPLFWSPGMFNFLNTPFDYSADRKLYFYSTGKAILAVSHIDPLRVPSFSQSKPLQKPIAIAYSENSAKDVLVVTQNENKLNVLSLEVDSGFSSLDWMFWGMEVEPFDFTASATPAKELWSIPEGVAPGKLVFFGNYAAQHQFILADERMINGQLQTVVQSYSSVDFSKTYELNLGADISNIAMDETAAVAYVAVNRSSLIASKLKKIDLRTGAMSDLNEKRNANTVTQFTELRLDKLDMKLYVADMLGNAIYRIDLKNLDMENIKLIEKIHEPFGE